MPWDDTARRQRSRDHLRYPSDLTDAEWALVAPFVPPAKPGGRPRTTDMGEVMNAILYVASVGSQWRALPKDFPPVPTVCGYFYAWCNDGLWQTVNPVLVMSTRELEGRKRRIITDGLGLMLFALVHAADIQGRDSAPDVADGHSRPPPLAAPRLCRWRYAGGKLRTAFKPYGDWRIETIRRSDTAQGFAVLPRRCVVDRTLAWLGRCRRLAKDWKRSIESATAWTNIASIRIMIRRLATYCYVS